MLLPVSDSGVPNYYAERSFLNISLVLNISKTGLRTKFKFGVLRDVSRMFLMSNANE